jgi:hypothetical protein
MAPLLIHVHCSGVLHAWTQNAIYIKVEKAVAVQRLFSRDTM